MKSSLRATILLILLEFLVSALYVHQPEGVCYVCSYYLYTYDKMVAPNVSLPKEGGVSHEVLGALLKQHYSRRTLTHDRQPTTGQYPRTL